MGRVYLFVLSVLSFTTTITNALDLRWLGYREQKLDGRQIFPTLSLDPFPSGLTALPTTTIQTQLPPPTNNPASIPLPTSSAAPPNSPDPVPGPGFDPPVPPEGSGGICGGSPNGCWGRFDINTDDEAVFPNTGRIVDYTFEITNTTCAPDGTPKSCLLINNQLPGPTIFMNWGDTARIKVINKLQDNGTSIHWHGITQRGSNTQDGTNGVTECPLAPGKTRVYTWQATQHGTYWYHSHHSSQYGDGIFGTIIVNGPHSAGYDVDMGTIALSEIYYRGGAGTIDNLITHNGPPIDVPDNILFNGTNVNLAGGGRHFQVNVERGKRYLMRFLNTGVDNFFQVGIDNHQLQVVAIDGQALIPYMATWVKLGTGQRVEAIVTANAQRRAGGSYWIRAVPQHCMKNRNDGLGQLANGIFSYTGSPVDVPDGMPKSNPAPMVDSCDDESLIQTQPMPPKPVDSNAFNITQLPISGPIQADTPSEGNVFRWVIGNTALVVNWEVPILARVAAGEQNFGAMDNIIIVDGGYRFAFWYVQNQFKEPHPIHMHGNFLRVLASGNGTWDQNINSLNFDNPMRRDTFMLPGDGYAVMAFETNNPGSWILHCHIAWHASEGLVTNAIVRQEDMVLPPGQLRTMQGECRDWTQWFKMSRRYDFVGSGL